MAGKPTEYDQQQDENIANIGKGASLAINSTIDRVDKLEARVAKLEAWAAALETKPSAASKTERQ